MTRRYLAAGVLAAGACAMAAVVIARSNRDAIAITGQALPFMSGKLGDTQAFFQSPDRHLIFNRVVHRIEVELACRRPRDRPITIDGVSDIGPYATEEHVRQKIKCIVRPFSQPNPVNVFFIHSALHHARGDHEIRTLHGLSRLECVRITEP